jgi:hypothetical protein
MLVRGMRECWDAGVKAGSETKVEKIEKGRCGNFCEACARRDDEITRLRSLIKEAHTTMNHAEVFIGSREKMHSTGEELYRELLYQLEAELELNVKLVVP